jgi:hypothetical protein
MRYTVDKRHAAGIVAAGGHAVLRIVPSPRNKGVDEAGVARDFLPMG